MDKLLLVWPVLDTSCRRGLGPVSHGSMALDTVDRLDVAIERTVGLGALSLRPVGLLAGAWVGMGTRLRTDLRGSQGALVLPLAAGACLLLQCFNLSR